MSAVAPDAVFVGRSHELGLLAAHLAARDRPSGGVLLISGPAGIGKTALVDHALGGAAAVAAVVRGYCPAEPAPPLWPWRSALRRAGVEIDREPDIEPAAAASARFAALAQMSDALTAAGLLTVVLEDLHWADTASLDLLAHVGAAASGAPLTIVGTARSPAPEDIAVRLADLGRYGAVTMTLETAARPNGPRPPSWRRTPWTSRPGWTCPARWPRPGSWRCGSPPTAMARTR